MVIPYDPDRFLDPPDEEPGMCAECGEDAEDCQCEGGPEWVSIRDYYAEHYEEDEQ